MFEAHKITRPLPGMLKLVASGAGIPGLATYLLAVKLTKEHAGLFGGLDVAKLAPCIAAGLGIARQPLVRIPPHRPALRLVKG